MEQLLLWVPRLATRGIGGFPWTAARHVKIAVLLKSTFMCASYKGKFSATYRWASSSCSLSVVCLSVAAMAAVPYQTRQLELTIVSAKHLKNVNWRSGDLRVCAVAWVDPQYRLSTKVDEEGDTNPKWREKLTFPLQNRPLEEALLTIDLFHDNSSNLANPLVGSATLRLKDVADAGGFDEKQIYKLKLRRPSGRPQGRIKIHARLREKSAWPQQQAPYPAPPYAQASYPIAQTRGWEGYPYQAYYGPSAPPYSAPPYTAPAPYPASSYPYTPQPESYYGQPAPRTEPVKKGSSYGGLGTGLAVGALAGAVGGLALGEIGHEVKEHYVEEGREEEQEREEEETAALDDAETGGWGYGDF